MSFLLRLQRRRVDVAESFCLRLRDKSRAPKGNSFRMSARPHRGSGSPQIFRDLGGRGIRDDAKTAPGGAAILRYLKRQSMCKIIETEHHGPTSCLLECFEDSHASGLAASSRCGGPW